MVLAIFQVVIPSDAMNHITVASKPNLFLHTGAKAYNEVV